MGFENSFKLSSYLLLLSGFIALFASGALGPVVTALYILVVVASWRARILHLPNWVQGILFFVFIAFFVFDALTLSDVVGATVHLLVLVSLVKLFTLQTERDYLILYSVSFGFLLFASAYTISISFLVALVLYIFSSILTFILFESKKAYEANRSAHFSLKGYAHVALGITVLIILISTPIFLVIPRVSLGFFQLDRNLDVYVSGFSDKVNLGDIGQILVNSEVVMRVKLDTALENVSPNLKWRGIALDYYDGGSWANTRKGFHRIYRDGRYGGILVSGDRRSDEFLVQQNILLEPFSNVIFGAPQMVLLTGDVVSGNFLFTDDNDSIGIYRQGQAPLRYVVYSDLITREETLAHPSQVAAVPEASLQRYLQLPELDPQIFRLAEEITEEQESRLDKALGIEYFLKGNYGYSLENQSAKAHDPLYDFLIETKAGHCEYFATAQAVLMRTIGIPTRVVNGFRLGEFNEFSDYFIVRQSDAHSWVEGYFPDLGWVEFDSTPSIDTVEPRLSFSRSFNQFLDAIDMFWTEIITFDRVKQIGFFRSLRFNLRDTWTRISDISLELTEISDLEWLIRLKDWDVSKVMYLVLGPLIIAILWAFRRYRRYFRILYKQWFFKQESWRIAPEYYLEMLDILNRKGFEKQAAETPHEFVKRIQPEFDPPEPTLITQLYYRNRFGNVPLRSSDLSQLYSWLKELRR
jgi:transglutaminase-like putative cysteine protease